ncbi:hypothetical protein V8E51_010600 [Hyaloscypha variabilis]
MSPFLNYPLLDCSQHFVSPWAFVNLRGAKAVSDGNWCFTRTFEEIKAFNAFLISEIPDARVWGWEAKSIDFNNPNPFVSAVILEYGLRRAFRSNALRLLKRNTSLSFFKPDSVWNLRAQQAPYQQFPELSSVQGRLPVHPSSTPYSGIGTRLGAALEAYQYWVTWEGRIDLWVEIGIRGDEISGAVNMNWGADWVGWPHEPSRVLGIEDIITISSPSKEDRAESRTCHLTCAYTGFLSLCYTLSIVFDSVEDADLWVQTIEAFIGLID